MDKKQEAANKQPKKKKHKGLKIFLIIFGILIVFPVSFVFISFFDTTSKEVSDNEITYQNFVSESFHNGIKKMDKENPQLDFTVDEKMIDGIMMSACDEINQKTYIPKMYCYINGNNYTFVMDITASFFKTRALMHTSLNAEGDSDVRKLVFTINGVTLGRLPIPKNLVTSILGKFINNQTLDDAFAKSGFHIKSDIANGLLTYTRSQFQEDVGEYLSNLAKNNPYLDVLLSAMGDDTVLKPHYDNGVTATFDLRNLQISNNPDNPSPYYEEAPLEFTDLENHKEEIITLLNSKDGTGNQLLPELDASKVFKYLVRGYDKSDSTTQEYINRIKETDLGQALASYVKNAEDNEIALTDYNGGLTNKGQFGNYCLDQLKEKDVIEIDSKTSPSKIAFCLPREDFNKLLADKVTEAIGSTIQITFMDEDKWYFDYITVDNIYTEFVKDPEEVASKHQFVVYLRINIAGAPVTVVISSNHINYSLGEDDNDIGKITFELKDIYFGKLHITNSTLQKQIVDLIPSSLDDVFRYNAETKKFEVIIEKLIPEIAYKQAIHNFVKNVPLTPSLDDDTFKLTYTSSGQ